MGLCLHSCVKTRKSISWIKDLYLASLTALKFLTMLLQLYGDQESTLRQSENILTFLEFNIYTSVKNKLVSFPPFCPSCLRTGAGTKETPPQPTALSSIKNALPSCISAKSHTRDMIKKNQNLLVKDVSSAGATESLP